MKHILITLDLHPAPLHMHSYLMCEDEKAQELMHITIDRMFDECAKRHAGYVLPIVLCTYLTSGKKFVRSVVRKMGSKTIDAAKKYHLSTWTMPTNAPDHKRLMKLH